MALEHLKGGTSSQAPFLEETDCLFRGGSGKPLEQGGLFCRRPRCIFEALREHSAAETQKQLPPAKPDFQREAAGWTGCVGPGADPGLPIIILPLGAQCADVHVLHGNLYDGRTPALRMEARTLTH